MMWLLFLLLMASPLVILFWIARLLPHVNMGKLGVVYDQAGKARVVGITNY
jgi:hypothetical protein